MDGSKSEQGVGSGVAVFTGEGSHGTTQIQARQQVV